MDMDMKISEKRYRNLLIDSYTLQALNNGGVDNWDWHGASISDWEKEEGATIEEAARKEIEEMKRLRM